MTPKDRLLAELMRYGPVFMGWQQLPDGSEVRTYHLRTGPAAQWHGDHWRVSDASYLVGSEDQVARRIATQSWPTRSRA